MSSNTLAAVTLDIHPSVQVDNDYITVGDIAVISCQCDMASVAKIPLGETPRIGYERQLTKSEILHHMQKAGFTAVINGERSRVFRKGQQITSNYLLENAQEAIEEKLTKKGLEVVTVKVVSKLQDVSVPLGVVVIKYDLLLPKMGNKVRVWAEINVSDKHYQTYPLWFVVTAKGRVNVVSREIERGGEVEGRVVVSTQVVNNIGEEYISNKIENMRARHDLKVGHAVTASDVEPVPAVKMGSVITVRSTSGAVSIKTKGYAMEDGDVGDVIRLRSLESGAEFGAKVLMQNTVAAMGGE